VIDTSPGTGCENEAVRGPEVADVQVKGLGQGAGGYVSLGWSKGWRWICHETHVKSLRDLLSGIEDLSSREGFVPIGSSRVRTVGLFSLPYGQKVVVKRYHPRGLIRVLLMNLRGTQWEAEWKGAHILRDLGILTPFPLALGERRSLGLSWEGAVVMEAISNADTLVERLVSLPSGPQRLKLLETVGGFVAKLHESGVLHKDLHADNILVGGENLYLVDLHRLRAGRKRPSFPERMRNLAQLLVSLRGRLSLEEEGSVVRGYLESRGEADRLPEIGPCLDRIKEAMIRAYEIRRTRRCLQEGTRFARRRWEGLRLRMRREAPLEVLLPLLEESRSVRDGDDPRALKLSEQTKVTVHSCPWKPPPHFVCIKGFSLRGLWRILRSSLRPSRAVRFWVGAWGLTVRGFRAPKVYFLWERRRWGLLRESGVVMEKVEGAEGIDRYVVNRFGSRADPEAQRRKRRLIRQMAFTLAAFHGKGVVHRDLKAGNLLVKEKGKRVDLVFLDLEDVRFHRRVRDRWVVRNLAQLDASMPACVSSWDRGRFLLLYGAASGRDREELKRLAAEAKILSRMRRGRGS